MAGECINSVIIKPLLSLWGSFLYYLFILFIYFYIGIIYMFFLCLFLLICLQNRRQHYLCCSEGFIINNVLPQNVEILSAFEYPANEFWVVQTTQPVSPGTFKLSCVFNGSLEANGLVGFYYSTYNNTDNVVR